MQIRLTQREEEVKVQVIKGLSNQQIASELNLSINTIKTHVAKILHKRGCRNRIELITKNYQNEY
ncbi:MAG: DNA-binding NarL/FixJ family response regulator [Flavobacteriales bacterium]|jgi:DNA-binding NarL/FixJ family response regulator